MTGVDQNLTTATDHEWADEALQQEHQRLEFVIQGSRLGTWQWNVQTNETIFDETWASMLGYTMDELTPHDYATWERLVHPDDLPATLERLAQCVSGQTPDYSSEFRMRHKQGHWVWVQDRGRVMTCDQEGRPLSMFGTHADISEMKQTEQALRGASERLQAVLDNSPLLISELSLDGRYLMANQATARFYGTTPSALAGTPLRQILPGDICDLFEQRIASVTDARAPRYVQDYLTSPEGDLEYETTLYPLLDDAGQVRSVVGIAHDVTERRQAESALRDNERYLRTILRTAVDGFWVLDAQGHIIDANDAYCAMSGYARDELLGLTIRDLDANELSEETAARVERIVANGSEVFETRQRRQDGTLFPVEVSATYLPELGGRFVCFGRDLTERKQREERIALLGRMLDDAPAAITIHDTGGHFVYANQQTVQLHGYDDEVEFLMVNLHTLDVPESAMLLPQRLAEIAEQGESRFEVGHYRKDGSTVPLEVIARRILWHGQPAVLSIAVDITDRKQADAALRESEERFRTLFEGLSAGSCLDEVVYEDGVATDYRILDVNPAYERIMKIGRTAARNALGSQLYGLAEPPFLETLVRVAETGNPAQFETFFEPIQRHLEFTVSRPAQGKFSTVFSDITERKELEVARQEQQALLEAIYGNTPLMLMVTDADFCIQQANAATERLAERQVTEMLGLRNGEALGCAHAAEHPLGCGFSEACETCSLRITVLDTIQRGVPYAQVDTSYTLLRYGQARQLAVLVSATPLVVNDQSMALVSMMDVTDRKAAEIAREQLQAQLAQAQKMESVGRLAGGVAHDFNNMLTVILGHTELALEQVKPDEALHEDILEIRQAAERSADLTRQLLAFARRQKVTPEVLDLNDAIERMLKMLRRLIGEDIDLAWLPGKGQWLVRMDPSQVDQILANLSVNARDAIVGTGKVTIETGNVVLDEAFCAQHPGAVRGEYARLSVSDDGCGMSDETLSRLFEPFFTTKELGKGTGLGLATIYGIVKQNEGYIDVRSQLGRGTTFDIYLPRHRAKATAGKAPSPTETAGSGYETILLVEDEAAILKMTSMGLGRLGYTILAASSPAEALRLAEDHRGHIDLVITDVVMPEMNGRDLAHALLASYPQLKCLYVSGYTADMIGHNGMLENELDFMHKPFSMRDLSAKMREILDRR